MKEYFKKYLIKDKKIILRIALLIIISLLISFVFFIVRKDFKYFFDLLFICSFFIFGFGFIYSNRKINKIRKKTKNLAGPLSEEEQKQYWPTMLVCLYSSLINMFIYLILLIFN